MAELNTGWMQGIQAGQETLNYSLRRQQMQSEAASRRLHERNQADELALKLQEFQMKVDQQANVAKAFVNYQAMTSPDNPNPVPPGTAMVRAFGGLVQDDTQAINLLNAAGLANQRAQPDQTSNMKDAAAISNFRSKIDAESDPTKKAALQQQLDDFMMLAAPTGTTIETTTPEGATTRVMTGRQPAMTPGGLTTAAATDVQKKSLSVDSALTRIDDALKNIQNHPQAIGPLGVARGATERIKGWVGIEGEAPISKARHDLALTFTELADSLRVDSGNMSLYEQKKREAVGDPSRWQESAQTAHDMMQNIQKAMVGRKLRLLRAEGKSPDEAFLRRIPSSEIAGLVRENLLSVADAMRWKQLK